MRGVLYSLPLELVLILQLLLRYILAVHYNGALFSVFAVSFEPWQIVVISLLFVWGGVVRSGIGFGGAALTLPLLLLIYPDPLFFLPIIGIHLLFFGVLSVIHQLSLIDWQCLKKACLIIVVPKVLAVWGVLQLPTIIVVSSIYGISLVFALALLFNRFSMMTTNRAGNIVMLAIGGYVSGTSLSGAPAIVPVIAHYVEKHRLRVTLFMLWAILVFIKLCGFALANAPFYLEYHLWLLPMATIGHVIGLRVNIVLQHLPDTLFYRILGTVLLILAVLGIGKTVWNEIPL